MIIWILELELYDSTDGGWWLGTHLCLPATFRHHVVSFDERVAQMKKNNYPGFLHQRSSPFCFFLRLQKSTKSFESIWRKVTFGFDRSRELEWRRGTRKKSFSLRPLKTFANVGLDWLLSEMGWIRSMFDRSLWSEYSRQGSATLFLLRRT